MLHTYSCGRKKHSTLHFGDTTQHHTVSGGVVISAGRQFPPLLLLHATCGAEMITQPDTARLCVAWRKWRVERFFGPQLYYDGRVLLDQ